MSNRLNRLLHNYQKHIEVPWQQGIAGKQKVLFAVYDKQDELKLQPRLAEFEIATTTAQHEWHQFDLTSSFPKWMSELDYHEGYFESPEDLESCLPEFIEALVEEITTHLDQATENSVFALHGVASLFGFAKVSELVDKIAPSIKGRLLVFFPGEYESSNYRLLDARDGWNYMAVPITCSDDF